VAGGDGESCVGLIFVFFPAVGNCSAAFMYFCIVHKTLLCVATCKLLYTVPKHSQNLFIS
jgi:hypothetical protein